MGKESRLRNNPVSTRASYSNGDRKAYDRDACPSGFDEHVWSCALYFEQQLEKLYSVRGPGRPVIYTEIYEKILHDKDLTKLLDPGTIYTSGKGEGGTSRPLVTSGKKIRSKEELVTTIDNKLLLVEVIIDRYFNNYDSNTAPSINDFVAVFKQLKEEIIAEEYVKYLSTNGTRVPVVPQVPQPDKHPRNIREALDIRNTSVYTEAQMAARFADWKTHREGGQD